MVSENFWNEIKETMKKQENREKYEALCKSHSKEDEKIKFHIKRIENYFRLEDKYKENELYKSDCVVSIRKVNQYFVFNGWK